MPYYNSFSGFNTLKKKILFIKTESHPQEKLKVIY